MSIPGTNLEDPQDPQHVDPAQAAVPDQDDDDGLVETVAVGGQKMAPIGELIKYRKEARTAKRELEALRPQIEHARQVAGQLQDVQPLLEQLRTLTPEQRTALATGKLPSPAGTPQHAEDGEARQWAEENGLISADGSLDVVRARRQLEYLDKRAEQQAQRLVAPLRQTTAQQASAALRAQAKTVTDTQGAPLATAESIDEAYALLPPELAANKDVAMVAIGTAMLIDRMKGRTPQKATPQTYGDPVFVEGGSGRRQAPAFTAEDRALAQRVGLSDKDLQSAVSALSTQSRRGIAME